MKRRQLSTILVKEDKLRPFPYCHNPISGALSLGLKMRQVVQQLSFSSLPGRVLCLLSRSLRLHNKKLYLITLFSLLDKMETKKVCNPPGERPWARIIYSCSALKTDAKIAIQMPVTTPSASSFRSLSSDRFIPRISRYYLLC